MLPGQGDEDGSSLDYWQSDYDKYYDYDFLKQESEKLDAIIKSNEDIPVNDNDADKKAEETVKPIKDENENDNTSKEEFDAIDDYQLEDNRQKSIEDINKEGQDSSIERDTEPLYRSTENVEKETASTELLENNIKNENKSISKEVDANADYALLWGDDDSAPPIPLPIVEDDKNIFDKTQEILNEDDKDDYGFEDQKQDTTLSTEKQADLDNIIDETKNILADNENQFENTITSESNNNNEDVSDKVDVENQANSEEDALEKDKKLQEDLQQLFNTFNKLQSEELQDTKGDSVDDSDSLNVLDYEEKFDKPYKEGLALSQRVDQDQDYELIDDSNLSEIFAKTSVSSNEAAEDNSDDLDDNKDSILETDLNPDNDFKSSVENEKSIEDITTNKPIMYENDALINDEQKADSADVEEFDVEDNSEEDVENTETNSDENDLDVNTRNSEEIESKEISGEDNATSERIQIRQKMVDDLTSSELDDLMKQFAIFHSEDLDVHSEDFSKNTAPIHIKLSVDEPIVVTSPNYPDPYPTNNIIDWICEGEGMGIELNVTDFAVNGALGDYVLVKPGKLHN